MWFLLISEDLNSNLAVSIWNSFSEIEGEALKYI